MRNNSLHVRLLVFLLFVTATLFAVRPLSAQLQIPQDAINTASDLNEVIRTGRQLEQDRRWGDALKHFENALRDFPGQTELKQHVNLARVHMEIARRYADHSFLQTLAHIDQQQALDLYSEVLLKIDTYHVNRPEWSHLVQQGMAHLEVALDEPAFVNRYPRPVAVDRVRQFHQTLHQAIDLSRIQDRNQAAAAAARAAQIAAQYMNVPPQAAILEFASGAVSSLDPYSSYLTGDQLEEVFSQIEGNFVGLGVELKGDDHALLIVNVIPGGPADQAGIHTDDRIVDVDDQSTSELSMNAAADLLKGPEMSYVDIVVRAPDGTLRTLHIQRRRVDVHSVQDVKIIDPQYGIGYLKLTSFQKNTSSDIDQALWSLHRQGMRCLVLDVRGNPGGLLNAAVDLADKFLSSGTIVSTRGRSVREDFDYQAHQVGTWRVPLMVLIDGDSASASEIFAGAIHDHHRGTVIGQRSYGKGSVQGIFPLTRSKAGLRLTTAKFYSPSGQAISHHGVNPDVLVHMTAKPVPGTTTGQSVAATDSVLNTAITLGRKATGYQVRRVD